jgi:hypothetical protein
MPHVSTSRPNSFSRCAEPPPRPPNRSSRTASCRGRGPVPLVQRAGGLRCSRLHSGVCSHFPRLPPVPSRLPHKSQFTRISYLTSASPSPRICWAVRPSQASMEKLVPDMGRRGFDRMRPRHILEGSLAAHGGQTVFQSRRSAARRSNGWLSRTAALRASCLWAKARLCRAEFGFTRVKADDARMGCRPVFHTVTGSLADGPSGPGAVCVAVTSASRCRMCAHC